MTEIVWLLLIVASAVYAVSAWLRRTSLSWLRHGAAIDCP